MQHTQTNSDHKGTERKEAERKEKEVSPPRRVYYLTGVALMVLLALTAWASFLPLGPFSTPLAVGIAVAKALLILLYFMHLRFGEKLYRLVAGAAFAWLSILFVLSLSDYLTRGYLHIPGK